MAALIGLTLALTGCGGHGVDMKLDATDGPVRLQQDVNLAAADMTDAQREAYDWAVEKFTSEEFAAKYKNATPRAIIRREAQEVTTQKTAELATVTAELHKRESEFEQQDRAVALVDQELAKITVSDVTYKPSASGGPLDHDEIAYTIHNDSKYGVSKLQWDAYLLIDDEQEADRHCSVSQDLIQSNGLESHASKRVSGTLVIPCEGSKTREVRRAKSRRVKLVLRPESVTDFAGQTIMPKFAATKADYMAEIEKIKGQLELAAKHRLSIAG